MSNREKEIAYRVSCLVAQGKSREEALAMTTTEYRALQEAKREHYRRENKQRQRERIAITPCYGLKSRVGKINPFSEHNKPSAGLAQIKADLSMREFIQVD